MVAVARTLCVRFRRVTPKRPNTVGCTRHLTQGDDEVKPKLNPTHLADNAGQPATIHAPRLDAPCAATAASLTAELCPTPPGSNASAPTPMGAHHG